MAASLARVLSGQGTQQNSAVITPNKPAAPVARARQVSADQFLQVAGVKL